MGNNVADKLRREIRAEAEVRNLARAERRQREAHKRAALRAELNTDGIARRPLARLWPAVPRRHG